MSRTDANRRSLPGLLVATLALTVIALVALPNSVAPSASAAKPCSTSSSPVTAQAGKDSCPPPGGIENCIDFGSDADSDGISRCIELEFGSDPNNPASTPEHLAYDQEYGRSTCTDGVDNNLDGLADHQDVSCRVPNECLGPLRSGLVRSGSTFSARDPVTGEIIQFGRFGKSFNPGDYRGTADWAEFMSLLSWWYRGCGLPIANSVFCIDFNSDSCWPGDDDNDGFPTYTETVTGSDPGDANSTPENALLDEQTGSSTCADRVDNDRDGRSDKGDAGCRRTCGDFGAKDRCSDEDDDGWLKYVELWYGSDPNNPASYPGADCIDFDDIDCAP